MCDYFPIRPLLYSATAREIISQQQQRMSIQLQVDGLQTNINQSAEEYFGPTDSHFQKVYISVESVWQALWDWVGMFLQLHDSRLLITDITEKIYLVSWYLHSWVHFLARHEICTNNCLLLQFPKETNTRGNKTLTYFTPFHTNVQIFD